MNLYRVTLKGMAYRMTEIAYGHPFVVAENQTEAVKKVQDYLDDRDIGSKHDRELDSMQLLAKEGDEWGFPFCSYQLFL